MAPENDLNEELDLEMDDATVITVPIDDTLSNSGEAADAKAVGDALALKADASAITAISVNGETADAQGKILVNATEIPLSDADETTVTAAIASAAGKTAATIPMSSDVGAPTISEAIDAIEGQTAATIPMEEGSATTIAAKIGTMDTTMNAQSSAITTLQAKTGETIMIDGESTQTVKQAVAERVLTVNRNAADAAGNVQVDTVAFAENLKSELNQTIIAAFTERTSGGRSSVANSDGWLLKLEGNSVHEGFVAESINMTVTAPVSGITATIDRDTFVAAVSVSGTTTINYTDSWSTDPATYGITVTGTPASGDSISVVYVKEERGTITVSDPDSLIASGWNLYNDTNGYARAINYSDQYGFAIDGTYTAVKFSATISGTKTDLTVTDKILSGFPEGWTTGYIWVIDGNDTDTAVWMTWEDWTAAYGESFAEYEESTVSLSTVMASKFPYGLLRVGNTRDELNISTGKAISRVERMAYSSANLAAAKATGRDYEYDEDYIYLVREAAVQSDITVDGKFTSDDHGLEWISGSSVGPIATVMYGNNLKNKLERDVVTKSQDIVDGLTSTATDKALSAKQGKELSDQIAINNGSVSSGNWNNLTTGQRFYYTSANAANWTNKPPYTGAIPAGIVIPVGSRIIQIAITSGGVAFVRTSSDSGSTWGSWNSLSAYSLEVSGTTSSAGTLQINDLDIVTHRIVSIVPSSNVIALPIRWANTASSKWGISFRNYSDYSAVASTSVSATVYYEYI